MYENIKSLLNRLAKKEFSINKAYILKIGFTAFKHKNGSEIQAGGEEFYVEYAEEKEEKPLKILYESITEALEKNPHVTGITKDLIRKSMETSSTGYNYTGVIIIGNLFAAKLNIPERFQKYKKLCMGGGVYENFEVFSNGSIFGAYAEIEDIPLITNIAEEYETLLIKQNKEVGTLEALKLKYSPLFPTIYVIITEPEGGPDNGDEASNVVKVYKHEDDVFVTTSREPSKARDLICNIVYDVTPSLVQFCRINTLLKKLNEIYSEIGVNFYELSNIIKEILSLKLYRFLKIYKLLKVARKDLVEIHSLYVDFSNLIFQLKRNKEWLLSTIKEEPIIREFKDYLKIHTDPEVEITPSLSNALNHYEGEIRTLRNIRTVTLATVGSALLGGLAGALVSRLFN